MLTITKISTMSKLEGLLSRWSLEDGLVEILTRIQWRQHVFRNVATVHTCQSTVSHPTRKQRLQSPLWESEQLINDISVCGGYCHQQIQWNIWRSLEVVNSSQNSLFIKWRYSRELHRLVCLHWRDIGKRKHVQFCWILSVFETAFDHRISWRP